MSFAVILAIFQLQNKGLRSISAFVPFTGKVCNVPDIPNVAGGPKWTDTAIRSILSNEKYCGDVLLQKTFISDCISRKVIRNTGFLVVS